MLGSRLRRPPVRVVGALLCFVASILALTGSFQTLFSAELTERTNVIVTGWDITAESDGQTIPAGGVPENGAPLVFAATLLLAAALLGLLANAAPARVGIGRANILLAAVGAAFLAGTTLTIGMQELNWLELFRPERFRTDAELDAGIGAGFWLLVVATVIALGSTVLSWLPARARHDRIEPETPPFGVPTTAIVHRLPDAPPDDPD
jgi:hypothetical protein